MRIIVLPVNQEQLDRAKNFPSQMGNVFHNIAVMLAPYDTGNLRTSIFLMKNTNKNITIEYNHLIANYSYFLEEGLGSVKKYKGFISVDTHFAIVDTLVGYIQNGILPPMQSVPIVHLQSTTNLFSWEKDMLLAVGKNSNEISPNVRRKISMVREINHRQSQGIRDTKIPRVGRVRTSEQSLHEPFKSSSPALLGDNSTRLGRKIWGTVAVGSHRGASELSRAYNRIKKGWLI